MPSSPSTSLEFRRGECAALNRSKWQRKDHLPKGAAWATEALKGKLNPGAGLKIGYFAQAHDSLNMDCSVLDALLRHKAMDPGAARTHLARYLFRGDDVFSKFRCFRVENALAWRWRSFLSKNPTSCCWMSPPTTWIFLPARPWKRC